jgi:hypothetical protein
VLRRCTGSAVGRIFVERTQAASALHSLLQEQAALTDRHGGTDPAHWQSASAAAFNEVHACLDKAHSLTRRHARFGAHTHTLRVPLLSALSPSLCTGETPEALARGPAVVLPD